MKKVIRGTADIPIVIWVSLGILLSLNGFLAFKYWDLRTRGSDPLSLDNFLSSGAQVEGFVANDQNGRSLDVNYARADNKTVLFYFNPDCSTCDYVLPFLRILSRNADSDKWFFLGAVRDEVPPWKVKSYLEGFDLSTLTVAFLDEEIRSAYRLSATPITIVIEPGGVVESVWIGPWSESVLERAEEVFGVALSKV